MRAFTTPLLARPLLAGLAVLAVLPLTACGSGGSGYTDTYNTSSVQPYHPAPGQTVVVPGLRQDETAVIDQFGDATIIQH